MSRVVRNFDLGPILGRGTPAAGTVEISLLDGPAAGSSGPPFGPFGTLSRRKMAGVLKVNSSDAVECERAAGGHDK